MFLTALCLARMVEEDERAKLLLYASIELASLGRHELAHRTARAATALLAARKTHDRWESIPLLFSAYGGKPVTDAPWDIEAWAAAVTEPNALKHLRAIYHPSAVEFHCRIDRTLELDEQDLDGDPEQLLAGAKAVVLQEAKTVASNGDEWAMMSQTRDAAAIAVQLLTLGEPHKAAEAMIVAFAAYNETCSTARGDDNDVLPALGVVLGRLAAARG